MVTFRPSSTWNERYSVAPPEPAMEKRELGFPSARSTSSRDIPIFTLASAETVNGRYRLRWSSAPASDIIDSVKRKLNGEDRLSVDEVETAVLASHREKRALGCST